MKHMSFRVKLTVAFIVTAIIAGSLIGGFSYSHSKNIVERNKKQEMSDTINRIDINVNVKVRHIMEVLNNAVDSRLVRNACTPGWDQGDRSIQRTYLDDYSSSLIKSIGEEMELSIINCDQVIYTTAGTAPVRPEDIPPETLKTYIEAAESSHKKAVWAGLMPSLFALPEEEETAVTVVKAIRDYNKDQVLGVVVMELNPDMFSDLLLGNQGLFQYQYLLIVDQKGEMICSNPKINKGWQQELNDRFERGTRRFMLEWKGKEFYVCGQYNGITGWKSFSAIPKEGLFPQAGNLSRAIWLVVLVSTLGIAVVIGLLVYAMTRPIKKLSDAMVQVQEGDFEVRVVNKRRDEIGELTDSFNYMLDKINTLIRQVYEEKIAQKGAEVQALQAQINPHFLYNTLDSVNWMLLDKGEDEISDIIISLGSLMRYSIESEKAFVELDREVEYVLSYLKIQKNRLEDRLEYAIEVDEGVKQQRVPKLILQPLIENAITHGIEPRREGGRVRVKISDSPGELHISVEDDGMGMTQEQLARVTEDLPAAEKEGHTGIGVRNVDRRIRLHYGEQYRIHIQSEYGKGTRIVLRIPKTRREERMDHQEG